MKKILLLLLLFNSAYAKDFGVSGTSFPLKERSLIEVIQEKMGCMSEEQARVLNEKIKNHYINLINKPKPVDGIQKATTYEVHYYDPTITISQDIKDHENSIIVKKGTNYNPLTLYALEQELLFFDGEDKDQVQWAKKQQGTWILINGKPLDLEEKEKTPVFYDQGGVLTKKFGIQKVPSRVSQKDSLLKIESFPIGGES